MDPEEPREQGMNLVKQRQQTQSDLEDRKKCWIIFRWYQTLK